MGEDGTGSSMEARPLLEGVDDLLYIKMWCCGHLRDGFP